MAESTVTQRQLEVMRLKAEGLSNRQVATRLGISEQTVKNHLMVACRSTGNTNAVGLVVWGIRQGLVTV